MARSLTRVGPNTAVKKSCKNVAEDAGRPAPIASRIPETARESMPSGLSSVSSKNGVTDETDAQLCDRGVTPPLKSREIPPLECFPGKRHEWSYRNGRSLGNSYREHHFSAANRDASK
jgi:hypothetical protein